MASASMLIGHGQQPLVNRTAENVMLCLILPFLSTFQASSCMCPHKSAQPLTTNCADVSKGMAAELHLTVLLPAQLVSAVAVRVSSRQLHGVVLTSKWVGAPATTGMQENMQVCVRTGAASLLFL